MHATPATSRPQIKGPWLSICTSLPSHLPSRCISGSTSRVMSTTPNAETLKGLDVRLITTSYASWVPILQVFQSLHIFSFMRCPAMRKPHETCPMIWLAIRATRVLPCAASLQPNRPARSEAKAQKNASLDQTLGPRSDATARRLAHQVTCRWCVWASSTSSGAKTRVHWRRPTLTKYMPCNRRLAVSYWIPIP